MKEVMSECSGMRDVTPGKWVLKNERRDEGSFSRVVKWEEGRKRVHVKEPSWITLVTCDWEKKEGCYQARNGDEHEFFAGPDM